MHTRMDLELTNFISSNLTWNTLKKGHRSMARHPRKPGTSSCKLGIELCNKIQDASLYESEKSGVAVLGQHFAEKVVDVPIKKRRLLRQSPSPPPQTPLVNSEGALSPQSQTPSPTHQEVGQLVDRKYASGQQSRLNSLSKNRAMKFYSKDGSRKAVSDFSGIELLASAACSSSVVDNAVHVEESSMVEELTTPVVDSYTIGMKETIAAIESDGSSVHDSTDPATHNGHDNQNGGGPKMSANQKEVRLHWDLNTVMDDWEEACYDTLVKPQPQENFSEDVCNDVFKSGDVGLEAYGTRDSDVIGAECENLVGKLCGNQLLLNSKSTVLNQNREGCRISSMKLGTLLAESNQSEKHDITNSDIVLTDKHTCEIASLQDKSSASFGKTDEFTEDRTCSREVMGTITFKTSDAESSLSKSDIVDSFIHPVKCEDSTTSDLRGETVTKGESDTIDLDFPVNFEPTNIMSKSDRLPDSKEVEGGFQFRELCRSDGDNKLASVDPLSDCCGSDVSHEEQGHTAEGNTLTKVLTGYDSPFEDGELREPIGYAWEDNEAEERVIDCAYYESDNIYEDKFDTVESEKNEVSREHCQTMEDGSSLLEKEPQDKFGMAGNRSLSEVPNNAVEQGSKADAFKRPNYLMGSNTSGYQLQEHPEDVVLEDNDDSSRKFLRERDPGRDESRPFRRNLLHVDGSTSFDIRRNVPNIRQSRSGNIGDSYSRAERDFGPEKFLGRDRVAYQARGRNDATGQWGDSFMGGAWDSRSSHGYPRPRNVMVDSAVRSGGSNNHENQSRNYSPRGRYRTLSRRLSPSGRNDSYATHRGTPVTGFNRDRGRGGSGFQHEGLRRASRVTYHDSDPCYLERKDHCFSSNLNRGAHFTRSRRRSRSRSRSRSPIAWHFLKGRNVDIKRQSPECRSQVRFQGERFPVRKPNFSGEIEAGFVSPTRSRLSPERSTRCLDDRNFMNDQFRDRRPSPVRMFRRNQKVESIGYPVRLKSDDYFRPTPHPGRSPHMAGPGRERKFDDSRKHDDRYETMNRVRRYYGAGGARRFRYAVDDSFEDRNPHNEDNCFRDARNEDSCFRDARNEDSCFRDAVRGDIPENKIEEKISMDNNDKIVASPLSAGERDIDNDALQMKG